MGGYSTASEGCAQGACGVVAKGSGVTAESLRTEVKAFACSENAAKATEAQP